VRSVYSIASNLQLSIHTWLTFWLTSSRLWLILTYFVKTSLNQPWVQRDSMLKDLFTYWYLARLKNKQKKSIEWLLWDIECLCIGNYMTVNTWGGKWNNAAWGEASELPEKESQIFNSNRRGFLCTEREVVSTGITTFFKVGDKVWREKREVGWWSKKLPQRINSLYIRFELIEKEKRYIIRFITTIGLLIDYSSICQYY